MHEMTPGRETRTVWWGVAAIGLFAVLSGCTTGATPVLEVTAARAVERTDAGTVLVFDIEATNPGSKPLPLEDVNFSLSLDGREVFRGLRSAESTVPRFGVKRFRLPVAIPAATEPGAPDAAAGAGQYAISGTVAYVPSNIFAQTARDAGVINPTASFDATGTVDLQTLVPDRTGPARSIPSETAPRAPR